MQGGAVWVQLACSPCGAPMVCSMEGVQLGSEPCPRGTEASIPQNVLCSEQARQEGKQWQREQKWLKHGAWSWEQNLHLLTCDPVPATKLHGQKWMLYQTSLRVISGNGMSFASQCSFQIAWSLSLNHYSKTWLCLQSRSVRVLPKSFYTE